MQCSSQRWCLGGVHMLIRTGRKNKSQKCIITALTVTPGESEPPPTAALMLLAPCTALVGSCLRQPVPSSAGNHGSKRCKREARRDWVDSKGQYKWAAAAGRTHLRPLISVQFLPLLRGSQLSVQFARAHDVVGEMLLARAVSVAQRC